jgi:hypothetical protein
VGCSTRTLQLQWGIFPVLLAFPAWLRAGKVVLPPQTAVSKGQKNGKIINLLFGTYFKLQKNKRKLRK